MSTTRKRHARFVDVWAAVAKRKGRALCIGIYANPHSAQNSASRVRQTFAGILRRHRIEVYTQGERVMARVRPIQTRGVAARKAA